MIEVTAALAMFSVGIVALMVVFSTALQSTSASLGYTHAVLLAQKIMEETIAEQNFLMTTDTGGFSGFPRHAWTRELEETEQDGLYRLEVSITWDERGREKEFALTTQVADRQ